ncbi:MAG TPA: hypothetical protein PK198_02640 [Saprospiraceae bacterium]|nr:hypothetical protein [Saprospiraceae bacterium]
MLRTKIAGIGSYVPEKTVTNHDLQKVMDTTDEWIQERTGIRECRKTQRNVHHDGRPRCRNSH